MAWRGQPRVPTSSTVLLSTDHPHTQSKELHKPVPAKPILDISQPHCHTTAWDIPAFCLCPPLSQA